ncbi:MAG: nucleotide-diphospho-sugar transferase [Benjaminiella poitrasii]|nr:MAG: nucleotide-diphospho-sugar transferase [Benjaminiella poitrasii]
MGIKPGESLLDAERTTPHRISIKPDQKRWWPKTIYHTYWSKVYFWIQKNILWTTIIFIVILFAGYRFLLSPLPDQTSTYTTDQFIKDIKDKSNDPSTVNQNGNYPSQQEKLIMTHPLLHDYILPDTHLDWDAVLASNDECSLNQLPVKAAFVALVQENDVYKLRNTMISIERSFNEERGGYPWIIISDKAFSRKFREWIVSSTKSLVFFGQAPAIEWQEPYWVDMKKAEQNMKDMVKEHNINNGESISWRRMTRYNARFIANHPLLKDLEYYWKVQADSRYDCIIPHDPFQKMKEENKKLSFALSLTENHKNLDEFHETVHKFIINHKNIIQPVSKSIYKALLNTETRFKSIDNKSDPLGEYSGHFSNCMMYNNFMIFSLEFLRSMEYTIFFDELDRTGGFFYHKWGDSFPQTIAAALFLKREEISFDDVEGYSYGAGAICPKSLTRYAELKCSCSQSEFRVYNMGHCTPTFTKAVLGELS